MKRYLISALAALLLVIAAPSAFAAARHVIFDPPSLAPQAVAPPSCGSLNPPGPCDVTGLDQPTQASFLDCTPESGFPTAPIDNAHERFPNFTPKYCLWLNNASGDGANVFAFDLIFPSGMDGDTIECDWAGPLMATSNCPEDSLSGDSLLRMLFNTGPMSVKYEQDFYLLTDFPISPGEASVTMSVPEPGALGLFGLGLLAIGVGYGLHRRRRKPRTSDGA